MDGMLVLWDVDHTLVDVDGLGREAYDTAFRRLHGRAVVHQPAMAGRTDRAIAAELLRGNGVPDDELHLEALGAAAVEAFDDLSHLLPQRAKALPGAVETLRGVAGEHVVQSLLTGNQRRIAEAKIGPFGLREYLDLDAGAYGWSHAVRAQLVEVARTNAAARYGTTFAGRRTVLVGDTPLDVEAAVVTGAGVLGVATGRYTGQELAAAGADRVVSDLSDASHVHHLLFQIFAGRCS